MSTRTGAVWIAALALIAGGAATAEPPAAPKWNQQDVLALAEQLAGALRDGEAASREAPLQSTALQQRKRDGAISEFRRVREASDAYVAKLEAGRDRDMTEAHFRNLRKEFKYTRTSAGDAEPTPKAQEQLKRIDQLLNELGRYYPDV